LAILSWHQGCGTAQTESYGDKETAIMNSNSPEKILALLAEMARCLNQNMAKVKLTPIDPAFSVGLTALSVTPSTQSSQG